jgi:hypothetical protein
MLPAPSGCHHPGAQLLSFRPNLADKRAQLQGGITLVQRRLRRVDKDARITGAQSLSDQYAFAGDALWMSEAMWM